MNLKFSLKAFLLMSVCLIASMQLSAQTVSVSGTVYEPDGKAPATGVSVSVQGTPVSVVTDGSGRYRVNAPSQAAVLVFQGLGYDTQTITVGNRTTINVTMQESSTDLGAVVVTALGLTREEKSLGYAVSKLDSEDITSSMSGNWLNTLSGKVAGLNFDQASTGPGGTVRVTLRGEGSLSYDNNEALFVIDGIPVNNPKISTGAGSYSSGDAPVDFGNNVGDLNPDDIESMTVLKGPSATALYGSRAANGAIIITTKSGRGSKGIGVTLNSSVAFERAGFWPDFQDEFGAGNGSTSTNDGINQYYYSLWNINPGMTTDGGSTPGRRQSRYAFGPRYEGQMFYQYNSMDWSTGLLTATPWESQDWYKGFFETGVTYSNSVSLDGAMGKDGSFRLSIKDLRNTWIAPNTGYTSQNVALSFNTRLNKVLSVSGKVTYYRKDSDNLPTTGYSQSSPLYALIWNVVSASIEDYRDEYMSGRYVQLKKDNANGTNTVLPTAIGTVTQKMISGGGSENPYWVLYEYINTLDRDRVYGNFSLTADISPKVSLTLRSGVDLTSDFRTSRKPWYSNEYARGWYREQDATAFEVNNDFLLKYDDVFGDFTLSAFFGGNNMVSNYRQVTSVASDLKTENDFKISNALNPRNPTATRINKSVNSFYGSVSLGWRDMVFLDITGRNDWSSTLIRGNWSFFYPSVSASVLLDELLDLRSQVSWLNMLKFRASWANVGNDTNPYNIYDYYNNGVFASSYELPGTKSRENIKPENVESYELGMEIKMFKNRLTFDAAWYYNNTTNQIIPVPLDYLTGARYQLINAGLVNNKGIELSTRIQPIRNKNVTYSISLNWAKNWNKLVRLAPGVDLWQLNTTHTIGSRVYVYAKPGTELGRIYGWGYERAPEGSFYVDENGRQIDCSGEMVITESNGNPVVDKENLKDFGSVLPDWSAGMSHSITYKNLSFSANFTGRWGGKTYSVTHFGFAYMGKLKNSLPGRYDGMVFEGVNKNEDGTYKKNSTVTTDIVDAYVNFIYQRDNVETNTFDTSFFKWKEARLDYSLPKKVMDKVKFMQGASIGVYVTNIFCITNFPQYDPEAAAISSGSINRGVESGAYPMTRSYGVNIKLSF